MNIEYQIEENNEITIKKWIEWFPHDMPEALSRNNNQTGDSTAFYLVTYETQELANQGTVTATKFFDMKCYQFREVIAFNGPVVE